MRHLRLSLSQLAFKFLRPLSEICRFVQKHVDDDERIVRAVFSPYHVKKNRLRVEAYDPSPGTDEVSVMRLDFLGPNVCKKISRAMEQHDRTGKKQFHGFAVLETRFVRSETMEVLDSRQNFCGHADISYQIEELRAQTRPQEPLSPQLQKRLKDLQDRLLALSSYVPDPHPKQEKWRGVSLNPPTR